MEVLRGSKGPWPVPTKYMEIRSPSRRAIYADLPEGRVSGELHYWLRHSEHGWYGYVTWRDRHTIYTEPIPARQLQPYPYRPR